MGGRTCRSRRATRWPTPTSRRASSAPAHEQARFLRAAGVQALVLDSEAGALRLGLAARLATELGAACHPLVPLDAGGVAATVGVIVGE